MTEKVYVLVPVVGEKAIIITNADNVMVLPSGHLIFRRGLEPVTGYAPGRWVEFVEVTDTSLKSQLRAVAEGGAGSA